MTAGCSLQRSQPPAIRGACKARICACLCASVSACVHVRVRVWMRACVCVCSPTRSPSTLAPTDGRRTDSPTASPT